MTSDEQSLLAEIARKLDILIALTATSGKDTEAQIDTLTSLGYGAGFIGPIVGLAPNAVTKRISRRKGDGSRRRRKADSD